MAALVTVYIVLGVLYESYIHPVTISIHAAFRRNRCAARADAGRQGLLDVIGIIGIVLLIGIAWSRRTAS